MLMDTRHESVLDPSLSTVSLLPHQRPMPIDTLRCQFHSHHPTMLMIMTHLQLPVPRATQPKKKRSHYSVSNESDVFISLNK